MKDKEKDEELVQEAKAPEPKDEAEPEPEPVPEGDEGAEGEGEGIVGILKEARGWYITALLVFLLLAVGLVIYLARFKSMDFLYAIF